MQSIDNEGGKKSHFLKVKLADGLWHSDVDVKQGRSKDDLRDLGPNNCQICHYRDESFP